MKVITADGPAASGKSTVAKRVAAKLGWIYVNTGNLYRSITRVLLNQNCDVHDETAVWEAFQKLEIGWSIEEGAAKVTVQGRDWSAGEEELLHSQEINSAVSHVAKVQRLREALRGFQRKLAESHPLVMEGRDIGSVIFPDAAWKFYIDASVEVRAKRRGMEGQEDAIAKRDAIDSNRKSAPLQVPEGAHVIDSTEMTLEEVVEAVFAKLPVEVLTTNEHE